MHTRAQAYLDVRTYVYLYYVGMYIVSVRVPISHMSECGMWDAYHTHKMFTALSSVKYLQFPMFILRDVAVLQEVLPLIRGCSCLDGVWFIPYS